MMNEEKEKKVIEFTAKKSEEIDKLNELQANSRERAAEVRKLFGQGVERLSQVTELTPQDEGFEIIGSLLMMPDEEFVLLAPTFIQEFRTTFDDPNTVIEMAMAMNYNGQKIEDLNENFEKLCEAIDTELQGTFSAPKRTFLKQLLMLVNNAMEETQLVQRRVVQIPYSLCHDDAKRPTYAHITDAGMDVYAVEDITINPGETVLLHTGVKVALPRGYELQVRPKSGRSLKSKLRIANTPGTIDAGYRDEIGIIIDNIDPVIKHADIDENGRLYNVLWGSSYTIYKGEKVAQLVLNEVPTAHLIKTDDISVLGDNRGGGFGSTGLR